MKPAAILAPLFIAFSVGSAHPQEEDANAAVAAAKHVKVCDKTNFHGRCATLTTRPGKCQNLGDAWRNKITSIQPARGVTCTLWDKNGCNGQKVGPIHDSGIKNLGTRHFNNKANSYKCS
ncbi:hypothetical protein FALBO_6033 [Fusarium albosuccineum]|uniref:Uncharacterized protein n=1 Tax=Fusarium albosuccineum TaxID=1237068 RepID=A0A8H4LFK2_9HYPO|nr:hypothetical protein FALBO_6033 [Fusarium albosuccineum]